MYDGPGYCEQLVAGRIEVEAATVEKRESRQECASEGSTWQNAAG